MHLSQGTLLQERYRIEKVLGQGGFGITYLAEDLTLMVPVAIKEYLPLQVATRRAGQIRITVYAGESRERFAYGLQRFLEEARALARFAHHANIVSVKDYFEANGTAYMVMEYVEGITFRQFLEQQGGRISLAQAQDIIFPIMGALQEVHEAGLLHRDISPDNIYLTRSGPVKLLDFGAARYWVGEQSQSLSIILKSGYAPEEQYRPSGRQGAWTDVYAVAATLYRALTGVRPPDALDRKEGDTLVLPSRLGVALGSEEEAAILKGLAVLAVQRFQSMGEFQEALRAGKETSPIEPTAPLSGEGTFPGPGAFSPERPSQPASNQRPREGPAPQSRALYGPMAVSLVIAVALLILGGWLGWRYLQEPSQGYGRPTAQQRPAAPSALPSAAEKPLGTPGTEETSPAAQKAPEGEPRAADLLAQGQALYQEKQYAAAIDKLEEATRLDPSRAEAHYYLGCAYHQFSRYLEAMEAFRRALAAKPDYAQAHEGLGMAYYQLDQVQEAIQALEQALNLDNTLTEARYYLGLASLASGSRERALEQYQVLQTMNPEKARLLKEQLGEEAPAGRIVAQGPQPPETSPYAGNPRWPWTSQRRVTEADLVPLSLEDLKIMRYEILARQGWVFANQDLREYFQRQPWYRPRGTLEKSGEVNRDILANLRLVERQNAAAIFRYEMERRKQGQ